jgi:methyltransferase (TIGR00027 family)
VNELNLPVDHVSDTAFLVALCRAMESERTDAAFQDRFAGILARPKAEWLTERMPFLEEGRWLLTVRTCLIDELLLERVKEGADAVMNLASGLDTRPYRLALPTSLWWLEADLPGVIDYKTEKLAGELAKCRLERIALDLNDSGARRQLVSYLGQGAKQSIAVTEGILPYLDEETVRELAADLHADSSVRWWLMDVTTPDSLRWMAEKHKGNHHEGKVALKFAPLEGAEYFARFGWRVRSFESFLDGSQRYERRAPVSMMSDPGAAGFLHDSGIALLERV